MILAGCAAGASAPAPRIFDLGIAAPQAQLPAVRIAGVRAAAPFDGVEMHYRLAWRGPSELAAFAQSRWAAPPAELLRKQLLRASPSFSAAPCALHLELHEFTQVFASRESSEAHLELRATLANASVHVAARGVSVVEPGAGPDAASGAGALARATDRALSDLASWVSAQTSCR